MTDNDDGEDYHDIEEKEDGESDISTVNNSKDIKCLVDSDVKSSTLFSTIT
jgi:hypothetical protein